MKIRLFNAALVLVLLLSLTGCATQRAYTDFTVTAENRDVVGYEEGTVTLSIPETFKGEDGVWYRVTSIDDYAFAQTKGLVEVTIPEGVATLGAGAFHSSSVEVVNLPASLTSIGSQAFAGCLNLQSINLQEGVESIGSYAFAGCASLESLYIPSTTTDIESWDIVADCHGLTSIEVGEDNPSFCSVEGVVYSRDLSTLICYPAGRRGDYTVAEGTASIAENAFESALYLTSLTLPEGVKEIGAYAFSKCTSLVELYCPTSLEVGGGCFVNTNFTHIYYAGTREQWQSFLVNNPYALIYLKDVEVTYTC